MLIVGLFFSDDNRNTEWYVRKRNWHWDLNLYQSALPSIHVWMIKEEFVILYTEFKWQIGVHFGQNAVKNNDLFKKRFE